MINKKYFIYSHTRSDTGKIFYIGIGKKLKKERIFGHRTEYRRAFSGVSRNKYWKNIVNKTNYTIDIIAETNSIKKIKKLEKKFIAIYGMKSNGGTLCNLTSGGSGIESFRHSEETKKIIGYYSKKRKRKTGYKLNIPEDTKKRVSELLKNRKISEETKIKISISKIGNKNGLGHKVSKENIQKLILRASIPIIQLDLKYNFVKRFNSIKDATIFYGFPRSAISKHLNKKNKKYKNYIWEYEKNYKKGFI